MCHLQQIFVLSTPFRVTKSVLVLIVNRFDNQIIPCAGGTKQNLTDWLRFETPLHRITIGAKHGIFIISDEAKIKMYDLSRREIAQ